MHETLHIALYGLIAAISPTVLLATLVVLSSGRGRINGILFAAAFLVGQTLALVVAALVGTAITPDDGDGSVFTALLELAVGGWLVLVAWQRYRRPAPEAPRGAPRSEALFARLEHVKPVVSFGVGLPLGVGAKRLLITILAATTLAVGDLSRAENVTLGAVYIALASVVVWLPVVLYVLLGPRADGLIADARRGIVAHEDQVTTVSALVLGLFLILDAIGSLAL